MISDVLSLYESDYLFIVKKIIKQIISVGAEVQNSCILGLGLVRAQINKY